MRDRHYSVAAAPGAKPAGAQAAGFTPGTARREEVNEVFGMSCTFYRKSLIEASRAAKASPEAAAHLDTCAACREFVAAQSRLTRMSRELASTAKTVALPEGLENELLAEFDAVRGAGQRPRWCWMTAGGLAVAASVVAGVLLVRAPWGLTGQPE